MCVWLFIFCFMITTSLGFNRSPGYRSSVMDGERPILRYGGGDDDDETDRPLPILRHDVSDREPKTEPPWVSQLRSKIIKTIKKDGSYDNAREDIQELIAEADKVVNQPGASPARSPLLPEDSVELDPQLPSDRGPLWMRKLKNSVQGLMKTYEKQDLNKLVEPIVERMQEEYDIDIEGIDVDPFGQIDVVYKSRATDPTTESALKFSSNMNPFAGVSLGGISSGGMESSGMGQLGMPARGMPSGGMQQYGMPAGGMSSGGMQQYGMPTGGMPPGALRQGGMPPGRMRPGPSPPIEMPPGPMPSPYNNPYYGLRRMRFVQS